MLQVPWLGYLVLKLFIIWASIDTLASFGGYQNILCVYTALS